jgi:hypothetical protein
VSSIQGERLLHYKGEDGKEHYKTWWLGYKRGFARCAARDLRDCWDYQERAGCERWVALHLATLLS